MALTKTQLAEFMRARPEEIQAELKEIIKKAGKDEKWAIVEKFYNNYQIAVSDSANYSTELEKCEFALISVRPSVETLVYNSPDEVPTYSDEIPKLDLQEIGIPEGNLILAICAYITSISDTYLEYTLQAALAVLATVVQRRIVVTLNGTEIFTNIWLGLSGASGYARKSVNLRIARKVLSEIFDDIFLPDDINPASMLESLATQIFIRSNSEDDDGWKEEKLFVRCKKGEPVSRSQRCFLKDEMGQLLSQLAKPTHSHFKDSILTLHSCADYSKELVGKNVVISQPYVCMLWATVVEKIKLYLTTADIISGFLARTLYVSPRYVKVRKPLSVTRAEQKEQLGKIQDAVRLINAVLKNSVTIIEEIKEEKDVDIFDETPKTPQNIIPFEGIFAEGSLEVLDAWVAERELYYAQHNIEIMSAYIARFQENIIRLAELIEIGNIPALIKDNKDYKIKNFVISKHSMECALRLADKLYMPYAVQLSGELRDDNSSTAHSGVSNAIIRVEDKIKQYKKVSSGVASHECHMVKKVFDECIKSLVDYKAVEEVEVKDSRGRRQKWLVWKPILSRTHSFANDYSKSIGISTQYKTQIVFEVCP